MKKYLLFSLVIVIILFIGHVVVSYAETDDGIAASGICGDDLTWELDEEGVLTISGTGEMDDWIFDEEHGSHFAPWYSYHRSITRVIVNDGVTGIGNEAFIDCEIEEAVLPESICRIGSGAFENCYSLTTINIPCSIICIPERTFANCYALQDIIIPEGVECIGYYAFGRCESLQTITFPVTCTIVESAAFSLCDSLSTIYYAGTEEEWNQVSTDPSNNEALLSAAVIYNSTDEEEPTGDIFTEAGTISVDQYQTLKAAERASETYDCWKYYLYKIELPESGILTFTSEIVTGGSECAYFLTDMPDNGGNMLDTYKYSFWSGDEEAHFWVPEGTYFLASGGACGSMRVKYSFVPGEALPYDLYEAAGTLTVGQYQMLELPVEAPETDGHYTYYLYKIEVPEAGTLTITAKELNEGSGFIFVLPDISECYEKIITEQEIAGFWSYDGTIQVRVQAGTYCLSAGNAGTIKAKYTFTPDEGEAKLPYDLYEEAGVLTADQYQTLKTPDDAPETDGHLKYYLYKIDVPESGTLTFTAEIVSGESECAYFLPDISQCEGEIITEPMISNFWSGGGASQIWVPGGTYYLTSGGNFGTMRVKYTFVPGEGEEDEPLYDLYVVAGTLTAEQYQTLIKADDVRESDDQWRYYLYKIEVPEEGTLTFYAEIVSGESEYAYFLPDVSECIGKKVSECTLGGFWDGDGTAQISVHEGTYYLASGGAFGSMRVKYSFALGEGEAKLPYDLYEEAGVLIADQYQTLKTPDDAPETDGHHKYFLYKIDVPEAGTLTITAKELNEGSGFIFVLPDISDCYEKIITEPEIAGFWSYDEAIQIQVQAGTYYLSAGNAGTIMAKYEFAPNISQLIWNWSQDLSSAEAVFSFANGDVLAIPAEISIEDIDATHTKNGERIYTATVVYENVKYTDVRCITLEALGHTYGDPEWIWAEDYSSAEAIFSCSCGVIQTAAAVITTETIEATHTEEGKIIYTATATFDGRIVTDTREVIIEKIPYTGWQKIDGKWYYYGSDGKAATGWKKVGEKWYYFNTEGVMQTGWQKISDKWYYLSDDGAMVTGWMKTGSTWYYLETSGVMVIGWKQINNVWYYFNTSGSMTSGWQKIGNIWYYLESSGAMVTGWKQINNTWYYFSESGVMATGWQKIGNVWYYFNSSGAMMTGWQTISDKTYYFKSSGAMAAKEWCNGWWLNTDGTWTYPYKASWKSNSIGWWYEDTSGWYAKNTTYIIDGKSYTFNASGYWEK